MENIFSYFLNIIFKCGFRKRKEKQKGKTGKKKIDKRSKRISISKKLDYYDYQISN